jgi:hypothetical protein
LVGTIASSVAIASPVLNSKAVENRDMIELSYSKKLICNIDTMAISLPTRSRKSISLLQFNIEVLAAAIDTLDLPLQP